MNRVHFILIWCFLVIASLLRVVLNERYYREAYESKEQIDNALMSACDNAAETLIKYGGSSSYPMLVRIEEEFFSSMASALMIFDTLENYEELKTYFPLLIVNTNEGFYFNYMSERDGTLVREWSELMPYSYKSDEAIYRFYLDDTVHIIYNDGTVTKGSIFSLREKLGSSLPSVLSESMYTDIKRSAISLSLETQAKVFMSSYNIIAGQYGFLMNYSVPNFIGSKGDAIENPSFMAVFQGYPILSDRKVIYNNSSTSATYLTRVSRYIITAPSVKSTGYSTEVQPHLVYHKPDCGSLSNYGKVVLWNVSSYDVTSKYGAYACPDCMGDGVGIAIKPN